MLTLKQLGIARTISYPPFGKDIIATSKINWIDVFQRECIKTLPWIALGIVPEKSLDLYGYYMMAW